MVTDDTSWPEINKHTYNSTWIPNINLINVRFITLLMKYYIKNQLIKIKGKYHVSLIIRIFPVKIGISF